MFAFLKRREIDIPRDIVRTLYHIAIYNNNVRALNLLFDNHLYPHIDSHWLSDSTERGYIDIIKLVTERVSKGSLAYDDIFSGYSLFRMFQAAAKQKHINIVKYIIQYNKDIFMRYQIDQELMWYKKYILGLTNPGVAKILAQHPSVKSPKNPDLKFLEPIMRLYR